MPNNIVSIIIPSYNGLPWLKESISSAVNQSYSQCEIIVIDDGSNDGTRDFIKNNYDKNIKYYYQQNKGLSNARNFGLKVAKGDYIQFLDSDDIIPSNKIENHVNYLIKNKEVDVVYSHCKTFYNDNPTILKDWDRKAYYASGFTFYKMLEHPFMLPHMPLSRYILLDQVGGFDTNLTSCIDYDYWLRVAWSGAKFYFLDDHTYVLYRLRNNSLSSSSVQFSSNGIKSLGKYEKIIKTLDKKLIDIYKDAMGTWVYKRGKALHESGSYYFGVKQMVTGLIMSRSDYLYKISFLFFALFLTSNNAASLLKKISSIKSLLTNYKSIKEIK